MFRSFLQKNGANEKNLKNFATIWSMADFIKILFRPIASTKSPCIVETRLEDITARSALLVEPKSSA